MQLHEHGERKRVHEHVYINLHIYTHELNEINKFSIKPASDEHVPCKAWLLSKFL